MKIGMIIVNLFSVQPRSNFESEVGGESASSETSMDGIKINDCASSSRSRQDTHSQGPLLRGT